MIPTEILMEEHQVILKVLSCLEKIISAAEKQGALHGEAASKAIDFIQNFADKCHHAKEEDRLFVVMEEEGIPRNGGPLGCMLHEHESGRALVREMKEAISAASQGDSEALQKFNAAGREFIELLEQHIYKEDQILFPMADQVLDPTVMEKLRRDFQNIEAKAGRRHAKYIQIARELCKECGIEFITPGKYKNISSEFGVV